VAGKAADGHTAVEVSDFARIDRSTSAAATHTAAAVAIEANQKSPLDHATIGYGFAVLT